MSISTMTMNMSDHTHRVQRVQYVPVYNVIKSGSKKGKQNKSSLKYGNQEKFQRQKYLEDLFSTKPEQVKPKYRQDPLLLPNVEPKHFSVRSNGSSVKSETISDIIQKFQKVKQRASVNNPNNNTSPTYLAKQRPAAKSRRGINKDTVKLPKLDKSFAPVGLRRKPKTEPGNSQSWINIYGKGHDSLNTKKKRIPVVSVDYDTTLPTLPRRPLPPLVNQQANVATKVSLQSPKDMQDRIDRIRMAQARQSAYLNMQEVERPDSPLQNSTTLTSLMAKLERSKKRQELQQIQESDISSYPSYWESSGTLKTLRSRRRKRAEIDRKVANVRKGVVLNRLPDDLIGNYEKTYKNLQYYLGRVHAARKMNAEGRTNMVYIPTGRPSELSSNVSTSDASSDVTDNVIISKMIGKKRRVAGAKMKYAHRSSNNTPSLDIMPWEDVKKKSPPKPRPIQDKLAVTGIPPVKEKLKKQLTVRMPEVPPPSPEEMYREDLVWPVRANDVLDDSSNKREEIFPEETRASMQRGIDMRFTSSENWSQHPKEPILKPRKNVQFINDTVSFGETLRTKMVADQLASAQNELKKRQTRDQKQVVISPFTVNIEDKGYESGRSSKNKSPQKEAKTTVAKPFTFSYVSSKKKINSTKTTLSPDTSNSYISHFVHTGQKVKQSTTIPTNT